METETRSEETREVAGDRLALDLEAAPSLHPALLDPPPAAQIDVRNLTAEETGELRVEVSLDIGSGAIAARDLGRLPPYGTVRLDDLPIPADAAALAALEAPVHVGIVASLTEDGALEARRRRETEGLPREWWPGPDAPASLLAAFVRPDDPALGVLVETARHVAMERARGTAGGPGDADRFRALWTAAVDRSLEPSPEDAGPPARLRAPGEVLESGRATALDAALLLAGAAERAGLSPLIAVLGDGALVGVRLPGATLVAAGVQGAGSLSRASAEGEILLASAGALLAGAPVAEAERAAASALEADAPVLLALDVAEARREGSEPLPVGGKQEPTAPAPRAAPPPPLPRVERWKRNLLDLTLRNRLLNHRPTLRTIALRLTDPAAVVGMLGEGRAFAFLPEPEGGLTAEEIDAAVERGVLPTFLDDKELLHRLMTTARHARASLEEGGAGTLYLAVGFLAWREAGADGPPHRAPLILHPLRLVRGSAADGVRGYRIEPDDDDAAVNVTLLQKLQADFDLRIPALEKEPAEEETLDVRGVLSAAADAVRGLPGWAVTDEAVVGLFSFTKYLMWRDLDRRGDALRENAIVRHLLDEPAGAFAQDVAVPDPRTFDRERPATETFVPLDADATQLAAVHAAADGLSYVLEGPPGTGKSQTIANLVCHALARGERVLFASEKMAALNVVHRRLSKLGLHPFCLELHSNRGRKRDVLDQLREAMASARLDGEASDRAWRERAEALVRLTGELDDVRDALHAGGPFGPSPRDAVARRMDLEDAPAVALTLPDPGPDRETVAAMQRAVEAAAECLEGLGDLRVHPWRASGLEEWTPVVDTQVETGGAALDAALAALDAAVRETAGALDLEEGGWSRTEIDAGARALAFLRSAPPVPADLLFRAPPAPSGGPAPEVLREIVVAGREERRLASDVGARYREEALALDLDDVTRRLERSRRTTWPFSWWRARPAKAALRGVAISGRLERTERLLADVESLRRWRDVRARIEGASAEGRALLGARWQGRASDWEAIDALLEEARAIRSDVLPLLGARSRGDFESRWRALAEGGPASLAAVPSSAERIARVQDGQRTLEEALRLDPALAWGAPTRPAFVAEARRTVARWREDRPGLRAWAAWRRARAALLERGLGALAAAMEGGDGNAAGDPPPLPADALSAAFERALLDGWITDRLQHVQPLRRFRGAEEDARVRRFVDADARFRGAVREKVAATLETALPDGTVAARSKSDSSEMAVLQRELRRKRNLPIRRLFERIPHVLARLKPCMLMSPLSVAQYLGPDFPPFDLVVFDEASQIPPWDAVGAIARGRRLVVVGDSKQLPPTNFFQRTEEEDDGLDEDRLQEMESILDECVAAGLPRLHLGWHYRSRHESLIAFSNRHYYEDRLITFPSAIDDPARLGVSLHPVPEGVYDRSRTRTNEREAAALVEELVTRLLATEPGARSYGVVTFSIAQQGLVEDLLEAARREHPAIERHFQDTAPEPVFVKNLENVQGDERDVILLSVCYGPDPSGRVLLNFGPLNREGGERRLNVAITRAREQMLVFSTLRADQVDLSRTRARGARHLRDFLEYAERGPDVLGLAADPAARPPRPDPFGGHVKATLEEAGWAVDAQVGHSAYRVDLAVRDPASDGRRLAALETDGATYAQAATARDRHLTRPGVLGHLGWRHGRLWALDWLLDPAGERRRLLARLDAWRAEAAAPEATEAVRDAPSPAPPAPEEGKETPDPPSLGIALGGTPYASVTLRARRQEPQAFYDEANDDGIRQEIARIIEGEAPVALDLVARRLAARWGHERLTAKFRARVEDLVRRDHPLDARDIAWRRDQDPGRYAGFRVPGEVSRPPRHAARIPREEIANAARALIRAHVAIARDDLAREIARAFGFRRATSRVLAAMTAGIDHLRATGGAREEDGMLQAPVAGR